MNDTELWNDAAKSMEFQGALNGTAACYERAKELGGDSPGACLNRAVSYIQLYEYYKQDKYVEQARDALLSAIESDSRNPKFHHYLGLAYLALGERENATNEFFYAEQLRSEEESDLVLGFNLEFEAPTVYETAVSEVYELLPDPALHRIFDIVKSFPMDTSLHRRLVDVYGQKDSNSLLALYLRSIYNQLFESKELASELGLSGSHGKWEALLVFFVRGMNDESKELVKRAARDGRLDLDALPAYSRLLVERYKREFASSSYNRGSFNALLLLPMRKLDAIDNACELSRKAKRNSDFKLIKEALGILSQAGLAKAKGGRYELTGFFGSRGGHVNAKLETNELDSELLMMLSELLEEKRLEYAKELAKKIAALYGEKEAGAYVKEALASISLSEDEKFSIISDI
ncbi:MAG: hypothetical protein WC488_03600 [Candidatus Micrarchaeia archaeon]